MAVTNPYNLRAMIPIESDMFFGREKEMRRIEESLSGDTPQSLSIVGERRIGKSSIANRVFHKIKENENILAVYIDCDGIGEECKTKDGFFLMLNTFFVEASENKPGIMELREKKEGNFFDSYSSLKSFINSTARNGFKTIIFMDEFEHLPDNPFADDTFFSNLRAVANKPDNRLAFVSISKTVLKELTHVSIKSSGFWNIFGVEFIGLLEKKSIEKLRRYGFKRTRFSLTTEEEEKIHYYAGGYPFFNQMACGFIWDAKKDKAVVNWGNFEVKLRPHYKEIWDNRNEDEQKLLKDLKGINAKEEFTLNDLESRGLVIQGKKTYEPFSGYFSKLIDTILEVKKKKFSEKEGFKNLKDVIDVVKSGKDALTGKSD